MMLPCKAIHVNRAVVFRDWHALAALGLYFFRLNALNAIRVEPDAPYPVP